MSPPTLSVSYILSPPPSTIPPSGLSPKTNHEFPLEVSHTESTSGTETDSHPNSPNAKEHYAALRAALANARETLGRELTEWRDAVGNGEKEKEEKKVGKDKNGEDEDRLDGDPEEEDVEEE